MLQHEGGGMSSQVHRIRLPFPSLVFPSFKVFYRLLSGHLQCRSKIGLETIATILVMFITLVMWFQLLLLMTAFSIIS